MCIVIHKAADRTVPDEYLENAIMNNEDSWGFTWRTAPGAEIQVARGLEPEAFVAMAKSLAPYEYLAHCRIATSGNVDIPNAHPFEIGAQADQQPIYMMHNGVLNIATPQKDFSDTWHFARMLEVNEPLLAEKLTRRSFRRRLKRMIGSANKLAFMTPNRVHIINAEEGYWEEGVWYSNHSMMYSRSWSLYPKTSVKTTYKYGNSYYAGLHGDYDPHYDYEYRDLGANPHGWGKTVSAAGCAKVDKKGKLVQEADGSWRYKAYGPEDTELTPKQAAARSALQGFLKRVAEDHEAFGQGEFEDDERDTPPYTKEYERASWTIAKGWLSLHSAGLLKAELVESDIFSDPEASALAIMRIIKKEVLP